MLWYGCSVAREADTARKPSTARFRQERVVMSGGLCHRFVRTMLERPRFDVIVDISSTIQNPTYPESDEWRPVTANALTLSGLRIDLGQRAILRYGEKFGLR